MKQTNFYNFLCKAGLVIFMATVFTITASAQRPGTLYTFSGGTVFYQNRPMVGVDARSFVDLGLGYAKDYRNVYYNGSILPYVDAASFRLKNIPGDYRGNYPSGYDYGYGPYRMEGYKVTSNAVLFNGKKISDSPRGFKDLGWGYAKDAFDVYFLGRKMNASTIGFRVLGDGYAADSFDVYFEGGKMDASTIGFKVLGNGYAEDSFDTYYLGKKVR